LCNHNIYHVKLTGSRKSCWRLW